MDTFKIISIIFMMIVLYQIYVLNQAVFKDKVEGFEGATQSLGGVDDANAINTLAQIARKLMDGGITVPGDINTTGAVLSKGSNASFQYFSRNGNGKQFTWYTPDGDNSYLWHTDKPNLFNITKNGDVTTTGGLTVQGPINASVNKWNTSSDGKNRIHFTNNAETVYGSSNGVHVFRTGANGGGPDGMTLDQNSILKVKNRDILAELDGLRRDVDSSIKHNQNIRIRNSANACSMFSDYGNRGCNEATTLGWIVRA